MKNFDSLRFVLVSFLLAATSLQAQAQVGRQVPVIVFEPEEVSSQVSILNPSLKVQIREAINRSLNPEAYTLLAWDRNIQQRLRNILIETKDDPIYDPQRVPQFGRMYGASKLIVSEALLTTFGYYEVYTKQIDVATSIVEKQGSGMVYCPEYLLLAARQAAAIFAKYPESELQKVEREIKKFCPEEVTARPSGPGLLQKFFSVKMPNRFGLELSYDRIDRQSPGASASLDYWGQPSLQGGGFGFRYDRYLAPRYLGLGVGSGLSARYYLVNGHAASDGKALRFQELTLRLPLKAIWRIDLSRNVGCFIEYGVYADLGLYSHIFTGGYTYTQVYDNELWNEHLKRFRAATFYGAGIQVDHLLLGASLGRSLLLNPDERADKIRERTFTFSLTLMF
ncbi:MAG: hypothetical protein LBU37_15415 [Tannerellaceae bacterium]|jgi:hypothetical protein|nr:hypothetical protein [Tannerellaceae bacterium]